MIAWLLRLFGLATVDLSRVADALAAKLMEDFNVDTLDAGGTCDYLRSSYMRQALAFGLPNDPQTVDKVARMAWGRIEAARGIEYAGRVELYG